MTGEQGRNADTNTSVSANINTSASPNTSAGTNTKKKSQFTLSDWVEGAVLLVTAVLFVLWLVK
ncbi:hypothetical protein ACGFOU_03205 [Streptomyces sp. NPDC048595]|uniref:hypothetical protein n=1 Tax=Streptomyces sp. NPDC048595 TaxID=3365576 RepID=UPI0037169CC1